MVKSILAGFCMSAVAFSAMAKSVDATTAQSVAYNFMKQKAAVEGIGDLSLAYTATSATGSGVVADFYIFNQASVPGFVIVAADDRLLPVLGYSTESGFSTTHMSPEFQHLLNEYQSQAEAAIQHGSLVNNRVADKWTSLVNGVALKDARVTSGTIIYPMVITAWDQSNSTGSAPTYNADCPYDANASVPGMTVTGCVATAMSQVMKFWNWPDTGAGSNGYSEFPNPDDIANQHADFNVAFHFDSMPRRLAAPNTWVAQLMYFAGVSVNMDYGTPEEGGSGAQVTKGYSYGRNCAEYAMNTYFKYSSARGLQRATFSDGDWIDSMISEMMAGRPVIYAGSGSAGGHCWVMDGFDNDSFFHFNWGWSDMYDGFFTLNNIAPGMGDTFDDYQEAIIHIIPDSVLARTEAVASVANNADKIRVFPNPASNQLNVQATGITIKDIAISDMAGRNVAQITPDGNSSSVSISTGELANGVYVVRTTTTNGVVINKVVIER